MQTNTSHLESNEDTVKVEELWGGHESNSSPLTLSALFLHLKSKNNFAFTYFVLFGPIWPKFLGTYYLSAPGVTQKAMRHPHIWSDHRARPFQVHQEDYQAK